MQSGLRFDRVALELVDRVRGGVRGSVPPGKSCLFTVTAPIKLAGKTAVEIERIAREALAVGSAFDIKRAVAGNDVRVTLVDGRAADPVLGFVHNPDIRTDLILTIVRTTLLAPP